MISRARLPHAGIGPRRTAMLTSTLDVSTELKDAPEPAVPVPTLAAVPIHAVGEASVPLGPALAAAADRAPALAGPGWSRALGLLWTGQTISHLGDSLFQAGIVFLALEVTGSRAVTGALVAANYVPALLLGLLAGAIVDRYDRRRLMLGAELLRFAAVGSIPLLFLSGHLGGSLLAMAMLGRAVGTSLFNPALKALIPGMTPRAQLAGAATIFQFSEHACYVVGPMLAVVLMPSLGFVHLFTLDAASFLLSALTLAALPVACGGRPRLQGAPEPSLRTVVGEAAAGLRAAWNAPLLRSVLLLTALDNLVMTGPVLFGAPLFIKETLGLGPDAFARALTLGALGMALGSLGIWVFARNAPKGRLIIAGVLLDGLTLAPLYFCRSLGQLELMVFVHALAVPMIIIPRTVLIQQSVPGELHGRAFALVNLTVFGMSGLSAALAGLAAEAVSPAALFLLAGVLGTAVGLAGFGLRALRTAK